VYIITTSAKSDMNFLTSECSEFYQENT